jgi:hypothetical protein
VEERRFSARKAQDQQGFQSRSSFFATGFLGSTAVGLKCFAQPPGQEESDFVPCEDGRSKKQAAVRCRERLGGLLKYYERAA